MQTQSRGKEDQTHPGARGWAPRKRKPHQDVLGVYDGFSYALAFVFSTFLSFLKTSSPVFESTSITLNTHKFPKKKKVLLIFTFH